MSLKYVLNPPVVPAVPGLQAMVALPKKVSGLCPRLSLIEKERTALNSNAEINTFISNTNLESIRRFIMSGNADKHKIFYVVRQRNILLF